MSKAITLQEFIMDTQAQFPFVSGQLTRLLTDIGVAAKIVNHQVNRAGLAGILGTSGTQNAHDEDQQKLDVFADRTFMRILSWDLRKTAQLILLLKSWKSLVSR